MQYKKALTAGSKRQAGIMLPRKSIDNIKK
jgi:hypothetical protein